MNEIEQARAEFEALTGVDPAAHRAIEARFDVDAARADFARAAAARAAGRWGPGAKGFAGVVVGGVLVGAVAAWLAGGEVAPTGVTAASTPIPAPAAPPTSTPTLSAPPAAALAVAPRVQDPAPRSSAAPPSAAVAPPGPAGTAAAPATTGSGAGVASPTAAADAAEPHPETVASGPVASGPVASGPVASGPPVDAPGADSVLPEKEAWNAARAALAHARTTAAPADYQDAAARYDAYLSNASWQSFRAVMELDRAEIALGARDYAQASARLRARLATALDPAERKLLLGMLVLAEAGRGDCEALRSVPGEERGTGALVTRCNHERRP